MTTTTQQAAIDLMPQLRDILHLPEDLDLPRLHSIRFEAKQADPGWTVDAMLFGRGSCLEQWEALKAWASGGEPILSDRAPTSLYVSGYWRKASVTVVVAEVSVTIWAHLDGEFVPPQPEPVHVTGAFAGLLLGGDHA